MQYSVTLFRWCGVTGSAFRWNAVLKIVLIWGAGHPIRTPHRTMLVLLSRVALPIQFVPRRTLWVNAFCFHFEKSYQLPNNTSDFFRVNFPSPSTQPHFPFSFTRVHSSDSMNISSKMGCVYFFPQSNPIFPSFTTGISPSGSAWSKPHPNRWAWFPCRRTRQGFPFCRSPPPRNIPYKPRNSERYARSLWSGVCIS